VALPAEPMARKDVPCRGPVVSTSASHVDSRGRTGTVTWPSPLGRTGPVRAALETRLPSTQPTYVLGCSPRGIGQLPMGCDRQFLASAARVTDERRLGLIGEDAMSWKSSRWPAVIASVTVMLSVFVVVSGPAQAAERSALGTNGTWPGVGTICEKGPGGASSTRGVSGKSIDIATFADPGNTVEPGLNVEFFQFASAFAKWCNAAGGIDGRQIVVHDRDAALFNAAQVTSQACQQDFMSVGGGMALDQPSVAVRVGCGLGQISDFTVSDQAVDAALQVNPGGTNNGEVEAGWYGALAKKYPQAIKKFGTGAQNNPSILEPIEKWEKTAEAQGYKVVDFQQPPLTVSDWTPYVQQAETKGVEALEPSDDSAIAPYLQAMNTAGYKPSFIFFTTQDYTKSTLQAASGLSLPPTYVAINTWPFELASKSPGLEQMEAIMKKYAKGDPIDQNDEFATSSWVLFAKAASACGVNLTTSCVLSHAAAEKNWTGGGTSAPVTRLAMSNQNPTPSDCFVLMQVEPGKFVYDKADTKPNDQIWHCDPKTVFHVSVSG
jgi:ABC-type branched-subunit amino acid transport system substrate-binding protein